MRLTSRPDRLVHDALDVETGDAARVLRRLALRVIEVGGDGDDSLGHAFPEVVLGALLQVLEDHGAHFRGRVVLPERFDLDKLVGAADNLVGHHFFLRTDFGMAAAHEALDRVDGVCRVRHSLAFRKLADKASIRGECDDGGRGARAFLVRDDFRLAAFHDSHAGIGGAEVDSDDFPHVWDSFIVNGQIYK